MSARRMLAPGPFVASQLRSGDPYELSNGHAVLCLPTGRRGSTRNLVGGAALETDPKVIAAGVDLGVSTAPGMLRAPDIAVGAIDDAPGWSPKAPPLAVEYADRGQDEEDLAAKIEELLNAGTRWIWVVRLEEERVEVHAPRHRMRIARRGDVLKADGVLENPVPVEVLFDREAAHEATLRNLLQRKGYDGLESVRQESREEGREEGREGGVLDGVRASIETVLKARNIEVSSELLSKLNATDDPSLLQGALEAAVSAAHTRDVLHALEKKRGRKAGTRSSKSRKRR